MPTQNVNITETQAEFIRSCVEAGDYNNASELVREALRLLKEQKDEHRTRLEYLRGEIQKGYDDYNAGNFIEVESDADFQALHEATCRRGRELLAREANAPSASTK